jgi:hypothetical protein
MDRDIYSKWRAATHKYIQKALPIDLSLAACEIINAKIANNAKLAK